MKTSKGTDITAAEAARKIIYTIGIQWEASSTEELGQLIDCFKITPKQEVKLREQLAKVGARVARLLRQ